MPLGAPEPLPSPSKLIMTAAGRRIAGEPSGQPRMARRWFSNWEQAQASMV